MEKSWKDKNPSFDPISLSCEIKLSHIGGNDVFSPERKPESGTERALRYEKSEDPERKDA
jgi:hypothetical protein